MAKKKESDNIDDDDIARAAKKWFGKAKKRVKKEIEEYQEDKEKERQEKLEKKKQDYIKEVEKKSKRKKAAKKGVQTRRKNTAVNLQSDLNDIKFWQGDIRNELQIIQEDLDELLEEHQAVDDEQLPLEYLKKHLEKSSFKMFHKYDTVKKSKIRGIISKYFSLPNDLEDWEDERLDLEADRALNQLKLSEKEEEEKEILNEIKKLKLKPDLKSPEQRQSESQLGTIITTENMLKKLFRQFFKNIPNWYTERISEGTRTKYENRNQKKPGFSEKVKKQDISIIDDFQTNDVQFVFSREKPNESKNEDLSMAVFGIKADIMFHKIMALKNFRNSLAHGNGPLDDSQEQLMYQDCNWIKDSIDNYLKNI